MRDGAGVGSPIQVDFGGAIDGGGHALNRSGRSEPGQRTSGHRWASGIESLHAIRVARARADAAIDVAERAGVEHIRQRIPALPILPLDLKTRSAAYRIPRQI